MRKNYLLASLIIAISFLTVGRNAEAHYLWIETPSQESKDSHKVEIYYGEFEEFLREKAGGRLDEVGRIEAWLLTPQSKKEISLEKKDNHFEAALSEIPSSSYSMIQLQELGRPVQDLRKYDIGIVKPSFYANTLYISGGNPETDLTIPDVKTMLAVYPVKIADEIAVKVFFKDEARPNEKVQVHAANGWSKEIKTNEEGVIQFQPLWPGQYVIEVIHLEKTPGEFQGVPYEAIRHRATFTLNVAKAVA